MSTDQGLRLPVTRGAGKEEQEKIHKEFDTAQWAIEFVENQKGFAPMMEPNFPCPVLTGTALNNPSSGDYTEMHAEFKAWFEYAAETKAKVSALVTQYKNEMTYVEARMRKDLRSTEGKKASLQDIQDTIELDPHYHYLKIEYQRYKQTEELLDAKLSSIAQSLRMISRQVEIKKLDAMNEGINRNMPYRHPPPTGMRRPGPTGFHQNEPGSHE